MFHMKHQEEKMAKRGLGNGLDTMLGVNTTQSRKNKTTNDNRAT